MEKSVATGHKLYECTEVEDRTNCSFIHLSLFGLCHDCFDLGEGCIDARFVFRCYLYAADTQLLIFIDRDGGAGLFLDALDHLTLRTDHRTDHVFRYLDSDQTRHVRLVVLARCRDGLVDDVEDVETSVACLVECTLQYFITQTVALDIHLCGGDTLGRTGHLEVHIAQVVFVTQDVGEDSIFHIILVGDKAHCHAGYGTLHLHTGIE